MNVRVDKNTLIIEVPLINPPKPSATGKTMLVATTSGNLVTSATINGKPITLGLNAYIKP